MRGRSTLAVRAAAGFLLEGAERCADLAPLAGAVFAALGAGSFTIRGVAPLAAAFFSTARALVAATAGTLAAALAGALGASGGRLDGLARACSLGSSRRRHTRYWRDWSSDVCSSE